VNIESSKTKTGFRISSFGVRLWSVVNIHDDFDTEYQRMSSLDMNPTDIVSFAPEENLPARFFFVADPDGYEIEGLQRHGHYQ
jgi:hypothetical protein